MHEAFLSINSKNVISYIPYNYFFESKTNSYRDATMIVTEVSQS